MDENLGSGEQTGNPNEEAADNQTSEAQGKSGVAGDPRFKNPEELYKSYKELESKIGQLTSGRVELEEKASLADDATVALMAERNISDAEARALLREESRKLKDKHADKLQVRKDADRLQHIELELQRRNLLDEHPEAKDVLSQVAAVAKATGRDMRDVFDRDFKSITEKIAVNQQKSAPNSRTSYRGSDDDEVDESSNRKAKELMEQARKSTRRPMEAKRLMTEALKAEMFPRK